MIYWSLADYLVVATLVFDAWSLMIAYTLPRLMGGAPYAWYLIMGGFSVVLISTAVDLYSDTQTPTALIDDTQAAISLVFGILFALGLYMLLRAAKRQLMVANPAPPRA